MTPYGLRALRGQLVGRYLGDCGYGSGHEFMAQLIASVGPGDVLVDLGCGEGKLRESMSAGVRYVGVDLYAGRQSGEYANWDMRPSIIGDVNQIPLASGCCRTVAALHVLEHVCQPPQVLTEVQRVLQPGGHVFMDVPFLHEIHHAPHDYFRYTPFSLINLARSAGLEVLEIRASGGYFRVLAHVLEEAPNVIHGETTGSRLARLATAYPLKGLGWMLRKLQYVLDLQDQTKSFTCGYHCVFRRPGL